MRFSLMSLIRLSALLSLGIFGVAVGISRAIPKTAPFRTPAAPRYYGVNGSVFEDPSSENLILDAETGALSVLKTPDGSSLEYASCSPWKDDQGQVELVGRVTSRTGKKAEQLCEGSGLALYKMSSGELTNRVYLDPVISGRACWMPGSNARVLFPAGDGELHLLDLVGAENDGSSLISDPIKSRTVTWECNRPSVHRVILSDPVRPTHPALDGRIIVSLSYGVEGAKGVHCTPSEIWWLKLDADAAKITDAGRLTISSGSVANSEEERLPNLVNMPDGRIALAYLARKEGKTCWNLRVGEVRIGIDGAPFFRIDDVQNLADDCAVTIPAFSSDGSLVYRISRDRSADDVVRGFSLADALGTAPSKATGRRAIAHAER